MLQKPFVSGVSIFPEFLSVLLLFGVSDTFTLLEFRFGSAASGLLVSEVGMQWMTWTKDWTEVVTLTGFGFVFVFGIENFPLHFAVGCFVLKSRCLCSFWIL